VAITRILAKVFSNYDNQKCLVSRLRAKRIVAFLKIIDDVAYKKGLLILSTLEEQKHIGE
jgi:hypothetical protein